MEKTTNYNQFKRLDYNRKVNESHIIYMMKIIRIKNRLEYFPIIVTEDLSVIDGQHRLEAAKRLQLPIYYEIKKNSEPQDVYTINIAHKGWTREDVLNYYVNLDSSHYKLVNEFMIKNNINLNAALIILELDNGDNKRGFNDGGLELSKDDVLEAQERYDKFERFLTYVLQKTIGNRTYLRSPVLKKAFVAFTNMKSFDFDLFMKKLPYGLHMLRPSGLKAEYLKMLINIYNWKNTSKRLMLDGEEAINE